MSAPQPTLPLILPALFLGLFISCKGEDIHPVDRVIASFSDSLPKVEIPEEADPDSENWKGADLVPKTPVLPLYPEEAARQFLLPEGYAIEAVLTEPQIQQPGAIAFDGNGRMYVLELRTYMLTADSEGTMDPISRISRWEDTDKDGVYETGGVFVDSLIFPRFVLPYGKDCILAMESNADKVYRYRDTDGDGKADEKTFFTDRFGRFGNVEHQQAFLYYGMDNWLYSTVNAFRVRETPGGTIREATGYNHAQWGITHDDEGKLWFQGGASGLPSYFQFPIHYGNFEVEGQFAQGLEIPWGAPVKIADMQGGMDEVRQPDGSAMRVTGSAGNDIFRGDRLPADLYGQYFYGEPVARIVRQIRPEVREGLTILHNTYQEVKSEFLRSTDPLFRPVDLTTSPDGTLYVTDMYHGIIQEGEWAQKGTYLRSKIEQYQLDKVVGLGRIWRITHDDHPRDREQPRMLDQEPKELLQYLSHPNGWWRDKAQQLIVLSADRSLAPSLVSMAIEQGDFRTRTHALWCLEGLGVLESSLIAQLARQTDPRMRIQALRAGESLYKAGETQLEGLYARAMEAPQTEVVIQAMLSSHYLGLAGYAERIKALLRDRGEKGIQVVGTQILRKTAEKTTDLLLSGLSEAEGNSLKRGKVIYNELCIQCHGPNGQGRSIGQGALMAPALSGSTRVQAHPDYALKVILHGIQGPLDGTNYPGGLMVGNLEQNDSWIADIASYIRKSFGNEASMVGPAEVARIRQETRSRETPYGIGELLASVPSVLTPSREWQLSASHSGPVIIGGSEDPFAALGHEGWTSGEPQKDGMWFEIRFPMEVRINEIQFDAPANGLPWQASEKPPAFPRGLLLQASRGDTSWETIGSYRPEEQKVRIRFEARTLDKLRLVLSDIPTDLGPIPWSIRQLKLFGWTQASALTPKPITP
jgi:mono/diheme cytochrome c family protein/glucose/arabinose dehydrogenase